MKIRILEGEEKIDKDITNYIKILEQSEEFWALIKIARMESKIPDNGFASEVDKTNAKMKVPLEQVSNLNDLVKGKTRFGPLVANSHTILTVLGLPDSWLSPIMMVVIFNYIIPPKPYEDSVRIEFEGGIFTRKLEKRPFERHVAILITEKMSIKEITKQIGEQREKLNNLLRLLPKSPSELLWLSKVKNIDIKAKINEYKKENLPLRQIGKKLIDEYGEDKISFEITKHQISTYSKRFRKDISKLIKNKPLLTFTLEDKLVVVNK